MFTVTNYAGFCASGTRTVTPPPTTNLVGWYDFSDTSKLTTSGASISTAVDKSTAGHNATQGTSTMMPTYAAAVQNGLGAALFSGTNGNTNPRLDIGAGQLSAKAQSAFAFAAVAQSTHVDNVNTNYLYRGSGGANQFPAVNWNGTVAAGTGALNETDPTTTSGQLTSTSSTAWHIFSFTVGGGTATYDLDGTGSSTTGVGTGSAGTSAWGVLGEQIDTAHALAQSASWRGYIGEVRIFDGDIGTAALQKEEGYLAWKWGLVANLPAGHPYKNAPP